MKRKFLNLNKLFNKKMKIFKSKYAKIRKYKKIKTIKLKNYNQN